MSEYRVSCSVGKSKYGKDVLFVDGYVYYINKKMDNVFYWSCSKKKTGGCGVYLKTTLEQNDHFLSNISGEHLHSPEKEGIDDMKLRTSLKRKADDSLEGPGQIIQRCKQDVPTTNAPFMPSDNAMRSIIHRTRNKGMTNIPSCLTDVIVPDKYTKYNGADFLIGHYTHNGESVIIFGTQENLKLLSRSSVWLMDGTFRCCPLPYVQIYSIHGLVGSRNSSGVHKFVPLVYGLLSNKSTHCYFIFLELIKSRAKNEYNIFLTPEVILTDFENAAMKAAKECFPNSRSKCCFFHLNQNIWKHIKKARLEKKYADDSDFAHKMRHLSALAYLEPDEIPTAFDFLKTNILPRQGHEVIDWFSRYYVHGHYTNITNTKGSFFLSAKKIPPQFPPALWSVSDCLDSCVPRTQNAVESWHGRWNSLLGRKKWNIYKTIQEFSKEQKQRK